MLKRCIYALIILSLGDADTPAAAAISYRGGWSANHRASRPMGVDIIPDRLVRFIWHSWFDYRADNPGDNKQQMKGQTYPAEEETK